MTAERNRGPAITRRGRRAVRDAVGALRAARTTSRGQHQAQVPPGGLRFAATPTLPPLRERDPVRALDFLGAEHQAHRGPGINPAFAAHRERVEEGVSSPELVDRVAAVSWYHTIELPGITTPGFYDHRPLVARYGLPPRLDGKRCLDAATFDGFWAFELERRGGDVTALDLRSSLELDLPPAARGKAEEGGLGIDIGIAFRVAADALDSKVDRRVGSVYDIDPAELGTFDLVHVADLLLHLERPLDALRALRTVVGGELHLAEAYDPQLAGPTARYLGGWDDVEWWVPSLETLGQWLVDAGFVDVRILGSYQLNAGTGDGGLWRAILRAR